MGNVMKVFTLLSNQPEPYEQLWKRTAQDYSCIVSSNSGELNTLWNKHSIKHFNKYDQTAGNPFNYFITAIWIDRTL